MRIAIWFITYRHSSRSRLVQTHNKTTKHFLEKSFCVRHSFHTLQTKHKLFDFKCVAYSIAWQTCNTGYNYGGGYTSTTLSFLQRLNGVAWKKVFGSRSLFFYFLVFWEASGILLKPNMCVINSPKPVMQHHTNGSR